MPPGAAKRAAAARPFLTPSRSLDLLDLDDGALVLELLLDLGGLVLGDAFLDHLATGLDQLLGLLDAEARHDGAHLLDDVELLVAARLEDDGELRLLHGRSRRRSAGSGGTRS